MLPKLHRGFRPRIRLRWTSSVKIKTGMIEMAEAAIMRPYRMSNWVI